MTQPKLANLALWGEANAWAESRAYRDPRDGKHYPSVTSILKLVDKSQLTQWAVNLAVEYCIKNAIGLWSQPEEQAQRRSKYRWKDYRDERAEVGDGVHSYIEALQTGTWDFPDLDDEQQSIVEHFLQLCEEHDIQPLYNEVTAADIGAGWMGTFDCLWLLDGKVTLVDLKTSKSIHDDHRMQLSALANANEWFIETKPMHWDVIYPPVIEATAIVHLRADSHEIVYVENTDEWYEMFLGYLSVWKTKEKIKNLSKGEK